MDTAAITGAIAWTIDTAGELAARLVDFA